MGSPKPNSARGRTSKAQTAKEINKEMAQSRVPVTMRDFFFDDPFFKNSWDDFDKVRERMFSESRDMWKRFDDDFRNMACMQNNIMLESSKDATSSVQESQKKESTNENRDLMRQDSKTRYENGWMFPRRWMLPGLNPDMTNGLDIFKSKDNDEIRVKENTRRRPRMAARWCQECSPRSTLFHQMPRQRMLSPTCLLMESLSSLLLRRIWLSNK